MSGLLKFITCGSVDDGKSTLIGHILYDAKLLYADQERALLLDSRMGSRGGKLDYSLLLDGLMAEREQGITIDVAYRYFTTERRSFIVADTPGHEEYTRNMAVGASFAELAVILLDATQGVLVQTRRHARICALMGIRHFVFAVNKMDLVDYRQDRFAEIQEELQALQQALGLAQVVIIPVSATEGDNVTQRSKRLSWYQGPVLLDYLEQVNVEETQEEGFYMPVQRVSRPDRTFRGFQGQIEAGEIAVGDMLFTLPSRQMGCVKGIYVAGVAAERACKGQAVTLQLDREVDVSRGCVLVKGTRPALSNQFEATLLWMDDEELTEHKNVFVKLGTQLLPGQVSRIRYAIDVNSGQRTAVNRLKKNEIARCKIILAQPCVMDSFQKHRSLGEVILIDRITNATSACGIIQQVRPYTGESLEQVTPKVRAELKGQRPLVILTESLEQGRSLERQLALHGHHTMLLEQKKNLLFAVKLLLDAGLLVLLPRELLEGDTLQHLRELLPGDMIRQGEDFTL